MCGIYISNIAKEKREVERQLNSIKFRGPDYTGIEKKNNLTLGHLRLAIIDLDERSHQPMHYKNLSIVFNGEIYNYLDVKEELCAEGYSFDTEGDTEVLLKAYDRWGKKMISKLNGMFAFAIYDVEKNEVFCSRDRLGVKPFYYYWKDGFFEICSQLRPISKGKIINKKAVSAYLDCCYIPSPLTIFEDVYKLKPGHNLIIDLKNRTKKEEKYWSLKKVKVKDITYKQAKERVHDLLKDAVKIRLQSDVPFGSFLSGGIDSALVTSLASKESFVNKIKTFSVGFEDPKYDESKVAKQYSNILGTDHTEITCKPKDILKMLPKLVETYDEPFADSSALPSLLLNKVTKTNVTMALSGDGGDESFLGYNNFDWVTKFKKLVKIPYFLRYIFSFFIFPLIFKHRAEPIKRILRTKSTKNFIEGIFLGYNSLLLNRDLGWMSHYNDFMNLSDNDYQKTADLNIKLWLENDSNVKVDRASMAFSVEIRSPFLDYRIIELARALPIEFRYEKGKKKKILRDILKEYIPEEVFNQPKKGFSVPIAEWIRVELKEEFDSILTDNFLKQVPNLNVEKFKKMYTDHMLNKRDYSSYIWRVYVLAKWYIEFGYYKQV
ncbi:asparagine synthase (glutamine-hydrolyzing) [Tenacibaculum halocynthiae]|uniref:asparagine synthase (glutamine-hydrolyzing) n=1 Tax=Tenacibaculum halocynthiae TaxID=1254437 RepID=UPI0038958F17